MSNPEDPEQFSLAKSYGIANTGGLNLDFLHVERPEWQAGHLFFDNTHHAVRETPPAREAIRRLDLNYYIPCTVMNRMIAVLGLGKTNEGDFLSSDDVQLLETLAGYIGIAVQNARLYKSLEQKAGQYERLKEFNENIVESISVGVLAVDLEDRIESWNSQMEVMFALPRLEALGRSLADVCLQHSWKSITVCARLQASTTCTSSVWVQLRATRGLPTSPSRLWSARTSA